MNEKIVPTGIGILYAPYCYVCEWTHRPVATLAEAEAATDAHEAEHRKAVA